MRWMSSVIMGVVLFLAGCGGKPAAKPEPAPVTSQPEQKPVVVEQKKEEVQAPVETPEQVVVRLNREVITIPMVGFGYRVTTLQAQAVSNWAKGAIPLIKKTLEVMPEGYVLEIRGHATPPDPKKKGERVSTMEISTKRAEFVYDFLRKQGINMSRVVVRGVGESEPLDPNNPTDPKNRRVTFHVRKK
ncbi:MAG: OmpA family protein [Brevinematales bacterium]|nr:OmpA family protein [Brevinematales bacterium]